MLPKTVTIIGGGLAGLTASILLNRAGFEVTLVEMRDYPQHRVCGEYISNEVLAFLKSLSVNVAELGASTIDYVAITSPSGQMLRSRLDLGGFGISRYVLDAHLYEKAQREGVQILSKTKVCAIERNDLNFNSKLSDNNILNSSLVIAAYGKRSNLDKDRSFFYKRSPYLGVKYHIKTDFPDNLVQLDNFLGGYCGTVKIEADLYNLCYLVDNRLLKKYGTIDDMEKQVIFANPFLKERFSNADFLNQKPEVINQISFVKKSLIENHIFYCGDAAGMISPLCGNGMAMSIHAAKILSEIIIKFFPDINRIESEYPKQWNEKFKSRLRMGRYVQSLFGKKLTSEIAVRALIKAPALSSYIMKSTHGVPFL